jgi:hypothetical protein
MKALPPLGSLTSPQACQAQSEGKYGPIEAALHLASIRAPSLSTILGFGAARNKSLPARFYRQTHFSYVANTLEEVVA